MKRHTDNRVVFASQYAKLLLIKHKDRNTGMLAAHSMGVFDIKIIIRDSFSLLLELYIVSDNSSPVNDDILNEHCDGVISPVIVVEPTYQYVIDIQARILSHVSPDLDVDDEFRCYHFTYNRNGVTSKWKFVPLSEAELNELRAIDFIFNQYAYYDNIQVIIDAARATDADIPLLNKERQSNIVAKGFESTGNAVRSALKVGGKTTGQAIRYLGSAYTRSSVSTQKMLYGEIRGKHVNGRAIEHAKLQRKRAETVHAGARSLTGALLFPVRWTGRKASELASWSSSGSGSAGALAAVSPSNSISSLSDETRTSGVVSRSFMDTIGGVGNAVADICKGVTEALGEIGTAVGDAAINHSTVINGEDYASQVTRHYVEAGSEIGMAGYKVANVAAFGVYGLMLDAAVEGATLMVCMPDYLVGPVLMQGYMDMQMLPRLIPERFFVVLRPWSISFYRQATDIFAKPFKIVITAMLDTLPRMRNFEEFDKVNNDKSSKEVQDDRSQASIGSNRLSRDRVSGDVNLDIIYYDYMERDDLKRSNQAMDELSLDNINSSSDIYHDYQSSNRTANLNVKSMECFDNEVEEEIDVDDLNGDSAAGQFHLHTSNNISASYNSDIDIVDSNAQTSKAGKLKAFFRRHKGTFLEKLRGGARPHIELCTVDCSTFLLFPEPQNIAMSRATIFLEPTNGEENSGGFGEDKLNNEGEESEEFVMKSWFKELKEASLRVETVVKKKSGADEVALNRRLLLLPKQFYVNIVLKHAIIDSSYPEIAPDGTIIQWDIGADLAAGDYNADLGMASSVEDHHQFDLYENIELTEISRRNSTTAGMATAAVAIAPTAAHMVRGDGDVEEIAHPARVSHRMYFEPALWMAGSSFDEAAALRSSMDSTGSGGGGGGGDGDGGGNSVLSWDESLATVDNEQRDSTFSNRPTEVMCYPHGYTETSYHLDDDSYEDIPRAQEIHIPLRVTSTRTESYESDSNDNSSSFSYEVESVSDRIPSRERPSAIAAAMQGSQRMSAALRSSLSSFNRTTGTNVFSQPLDHFLDPVRNLALRSLRVRVVPLTDKGLYVKGENHSSSFSNTERHVFQGQNVAYAMRNSFPPGFEVDDDGEYEDEDDMRCPSSPSPLDQMLHTLYGETNEVLRISSWESESIQVGTKYCISSTDCKYLTFTLQGKLILGNVVVEVGRGRLRIEDITGEARNVWVPLMHKTTRKRVGYLLLAINAVFL